MTDDAMKTVDPFDIPDDGPVADLARQIASWAGGDVRIAVYRSAKVILQAERSRAEQANRDGWNAAIEEAAKVAFDREFSWREQADKLFEMDIDPAHSKLASQRVEEAKAISTAIRALAKP